MGYSEEFGNEKGWSAVDVSVRLNNDPGRKFIAFLRTQGVGIVIRYYASTARPKTLTADEAIFLSKEGFAILPVFQDRNRDPADFSAASGKANARSAIDFAGRVGQQAGKNSTILFAVDADLPAADIDSHVLAYFDAIRNEMENAFAVGAYGSGAVLARLLHHGLITVPWLCMSRAFLGSEQFFYSNRWAMRQVPPELRHNGLGIGYDRNVVRIPHAALGTFQVGAEGNGAPAWDPARDAVLGNAAAAPSALAAATTDIHVTTEGVRLRERPSGPILRELTIGERLVDLGMPDQGWRRVRSGAQEGYVHQKYLRDPGHPAIEALLRAAIDEWLRFDKGRADERADPYCGYVAEMWAALGEAYDGRSRFPNGEEVPWSAAFISWVVRKAGSPYEGFKHASAHSVFVHNAIKARMTNRTEKPFWGYRITEQAPALGDIIQRNRKDKVSFSFAENHLHYPSHSDIVIEVTPDVVRVIGGNVGDTVALGASPQEYEVDAQGFLRAGQGVIALLKNRTGLV